jgi:hypothetical protein
MTPQAGIGSTFGLIDSHRGKLLLAADTATATATATSKELDADDADSFKGETARIPQLQPQLQLQLQESLLKAPRVQGLDGRPCQFM